MKNDSTKKTLCKQELFKVYKIDKPDEGSFLLQVDWILENAVYPIDNKYTDNLLDLWNVYMPNEKLESIVLDYAKLEYPMIPYIQSNSLNKFTTTKLLKNIAIKNYLKYLISQGETNRMNLIQTIFNVFKDISDRNWLYKDINEVIELYFDNDNVSQYSAMFLKRFQDSSVHIYEDLLKRLTQQQKIADTILNSRQELYQQLEVHTLDFKTFSTLINILLCKIALNTSNAPTEEVIAKNWNQLFSNIPYTSDVYTFINQYEKSYLLVSQFSIIATNKIGIIKTIYKDIIILCAAIDSIEKNERFNLKLVQKLWEKEGTLFKDDFYLKDRFEQINSWLDYEILLKYKDIFKQIHLQLLDRINAENNNLSINSIQNKSSDATFSSNNNMVSPDGDLTSKKDKQISNLYKRIADLEIQYAKNNELSNQINLYLKEISELKEEVEITKKQTLSDFISLLDSKNYNYILGKLYRIAYKEYNQTSLNDIKLILKNLFEVINISGIDIYGDIDSSVSITDIKKGDYRVNTEIVNTAKIKYPGYKIGSQIILHPLAEED